MRERVWRGVRGAERWLDRVLVATMVIVSATELTLSAFPGFWLLLTVAAVDAFGAVAVALRRRRPLTLAVGFATACLVPGVVIGSRWFNAPSDSFTIATLILTYTAGACLDRLPALLGLIALCAGSGGGDFSDPIVLVVFTVPAWMAGTAMRSRTQLTAQLAERAAELDRERDAYAREAVRYERARIARDLHDVVAHNLVMIVVQAGAGRRALATEPDITAEALSHIRDGAADAEREIAQLVELLAVDHTRGGQPGLAALDRLVRRAALTGLPIRYSFTGDRDTVPSTLGDVAFQVTREGITNALKHAPGAPISVTVDVTRGQFSVVVENGSPATTPADLAGTGGTHGLDGLRARVEAASGALRAGRTSTGGWRIEVSIPTG